MSILSRFNASLKDRRAEELLDLWLYRPLAFVLAQGLVRTAVTPNQITLAALLAALAAGACFAMGDRTGLTLGALLYVLSNILDCADGMVARIKRNGTQLGRMIDVFADSVSGALVYVGLGIGLSGGAWELPLPAWLLVVAGGISFALHAALFDRARNRFLSHGAWPTGSIERELAAVASTVQLEPRAAKRLVASLYLRYMRWQSGDAPMLVDARAMRLWSLIGSTTHVTVVAVAMLLGAPIVLFVYTIALANLWCAWLLVRSGRLAATGGSRRLEIEAPGEVVGVILAAGTGTRLRPLTEEVPKPLVEVAGRSLLARSIDALRSAGVGRFVIVAGHRAASVARFLDREYPELDAELLYNHRYAESNNAVSVHLAARALAGGRMLLIDGDLLFEPSIARDLLAGPSRGARLVVRRSESLGEEEVKVELDARGTICTIGKELEMSRSFGESIGMALFDRRTTARFFATLEERLAGAAGPGEFYEASIQQMIDEGVEIGIVETGERYGIEIDTLDDLDEAEAMLDNAIAVA